MNPLERLKRVRKAHRLYDALVEGDTSVLDELFPFVKLALTPEPIPPPHPPPESPPPRAPEPLPLRQPKQPLPPPRITYRVRSEEDDLRDALDIGFSQLKFDGLEDQER